MSRFFGIQRHAVPEGWRQRQATTARQTGVRTPSTVLGAAVTLVQPPASGHCRPVAQVPTEGIRRERRDRRSGTSNTATDQSVGKPVIRHRVQSAIRTTVPDGRGDEREQATRGHAQGRVAGGRGCGVQRGVFGTVQGSAQRTEHCRPAGQPYWAIRVRRRPSIGGFGLPVRAERTVRAAPGRPEGGQSASQHGAPDGRGADGRRNGTVGKLPDATGNGRRRRSGSLRRPPFRLEVVDCSGRGSGGCGGKGGSGGMRTDAFVVLDGPAAAAAFSAPNHTPTVIVSSGSVTRVGGGNRWLKSRQRKTSTVRFIDGVHTTRYTGKTIQ